MRSLCVAVAVVLAAASATARADRVYLTTGALIEGKARTEADRIVVELESGELGLPKDSVARIEPSPSPVESLQAHRQKLAPADVAGRIQLADYCRDHLMHARERELLLEVIELAPDHAEARERLGYVRTEHGWVDRDEQRRARGLVEHQGRWLTPEQLLELERLRAQTETAAHERDRAKAELEAKRVELETKQAEAKAEAAKAEAAEAEAAKAEAERADDAARPASEPVVVHGYAYGYALWPYGYFEDRARVRRTARKRDDKAGERRVPFPIVGAKDPFEYLR